MESRISFRQRSGIAIGTGLVVGAVAGLIEAVLLNVSGLSHAGSEILYGLAAYATLGAVVGLALSLVWTLSRSDRLDRHAVPAALSFQCSFFILLLAGFRLNMLRAVPPAGSTRGLLLNGLFLLAVAALGIGLAVLLARRGSRAWTRIGHALSALSPVLIAVTIAAVLFAAGEGLLHRRSRAAAARPPAGEQAFHPNVIIILSDALRRDHLSSYGYGRKTSPNLDRLMDESVTFDHVTSSSNLTIPSIASLFTGTSPSTLGPFRVASPLPEDRTTLAEAMAGAGYLCGCFLGNEIVETGKGFLRGFHSRYPPPRPFWCHRVRTAAERIAMRLIQGSDPRGGPRLLADARVWIEKNRDRPLFAFIHLLDPHSPYNPPAPYDRRFDPDYHGPPMLRPPLYLLPAGAPFKDWEALGPGGGALPEPERRNMEARYDGEIAWVDVLVKAFLDHLREEGLYDDALILFTSDHGEEFYEHGGWFHGQSLYEELVGIPLVVKFPGGDGAGGWRSDPVVGFDIMPSILGTADIPVPEGVEGVDVFGPAGVQPEERPIFSERPPYLYSVRQGRWKLVRKERGAEVGLRLYDLVEDPGELENVADRYPDLRDRLAALVAPRVIEVGEEEGGPEAGELNPYDRERLRALGYLQ